MRGRHIIALVLASAIAILGAVTHRDGAVLLGFGAFAITIATILAREEVRP